MIRRNAWELSNTPAPSASLMLKFRENEILAPYTYYKIGGPARYFFEAASSAEVAEAIDFAKSKNLQFFILGAGSNILISDKGFAGVVIRVKILDFDVGEDFMRAGAGLSVAKPVAKSVENGFGGIELGDRDTGQCRRVDKRQCRVFRRRSKRYRKARRSIGFAGRRY